MKNFYDFNFKLLNGKEIPLSIYEGKVLLIVNTASHCGYTPQLAALEKIYEEYKDKGFEVLGFPSNDFGKQEPLDDCDIANWYEKNFNVSFPLFEKSIVSGRLTTDHCRNPLFHFLAHKTKMLGLFPNYPRWNFHKYLVNRKGEPVDYFLTTTKPDSWKVKGRIEKLLKDS